MNPAAKHFDIVAGFLDIHIVMLPGTPPFPMPLPHPFIGVVFDAIDWIPITIKIPKSWAEKMAGAMQKVEGGMEAVGIDLGAQKSTSGGGGTAGGGALGRAAQGAADAAGGGEDAPAPQEVNEDNLSLGPSGKDYVSIPLNASVWVNGVPRGHAGTAGFGPPHFPLGLSFQRPPVAAQKSKCELLLGSKTVLADGSPFSYDGLRVLSCTCVGAPPMPRNKKKAEPGFFLPASCVYPIPTGPPVLVGGPPTVNWMAMAFKLPGALKKLRASKLSKKIGEKLRKAASKIFKNPSKINRVLCAIFGEPVDGATGMVFSENVDFELPGPIPLKWERVWYSTSTNEGDLGYGWHHSYEMALGFDEKEQVVAFRLPDGRSIGAPYLKLGEKFFNRQERLEFFRDEKGYGILNCSEDLVYRFSDRPLGAYHPIVRIENFTGQAILFDYKPDGSLTRITDSAGRLFKVNTDWKGRITSIMAPHPDKPGDSFAIVSYEFDVHNDMVKCSDAMGYYFQYFYQNHLLTRTTFPSGINFYWKYDGKDHNARCIHTWGDGGIHDHKLTYYPAEQYTIDENSLGHKTTIFYNDQGLVYRTIDPLGNATSKRYNQNSEVLSETDGLGAVTSYSYDDDGNNTSIIFPDGSSVEMQYQDFHLISATDKNGSSWKWDYDKAGQLLKATDPTGRQFQFQYENSLLKKTVDPAGNITVLDYDKQFNLIALSAPDGATSRWEYDNLGRCVTGIDPKGNAQRRKFNINGWVREVKEPDGNLRELDYDPEGRLIRLKDFHNDIRFEYAGAGHLKARIQAGTRVEFEYDKEEELIGIINEDGYVYRFERDANGNIITETSFDGVISRYLRDAANRVVEVKGANGLVTKYSYDSLNQVTKTEYSDGSWEVFSYRPDGELIMAKNEHITVKIEYDQLGRIVKETQGGFVVNSEYNLLGMRTKLTSSLGARLRIDHNSMGDVEKVSADTNGPAWEASFKRDKLGLELERALPGGVRSEWKRDRIGRPTEHKTVTIGGNVTRDRKYFWDVNERLKQIIDPKKGSWKFEHDALDNLVSVQYPDGAFEFRMPDAVGNLFRNRDRTDRKYGPAGQLLEANGTRYEYDVEGNLIQKTESNGAVWLYEWNASGMLRKVVRPDRDSVTFTYDALGRRIAKHYRGKTTRWVWDDDVPLHEWVEVQSYSTEKEDTLPDAGSRGAIRIRRREEQLASAPAHAPPVSAEALKEETYEKTIPPPQANHLTTWIFEPESFSPLAKLNGHEQLSIVTDHLGTPVGMYDSAGTKTWDMDLSIYGEVQQMDGWREACPFRYPGQYEDVETGLYYNGFRYYDPQLGLYINRDPIGLSGGNPTLYGYVKDPMIWVDAFGLACKKYSVYVLKKNGKVVYVGITDQKPKARMRQHKNSKKYPKDFDTMEVIDDGLTRRQARNIEGSALTHIKDGNISTGTMQNRKRLDGGYYHSYNQNPGKGRQFLDSNSIQTKIDNGTLVK